MLLEATGIFVCWDPQAALGAGAGEFSGKTVQPGAVGAVGAVASFSAVSHGSRSGKRELKFGWEVGRVLFEDVDELDDGLAIDDERWSDLFEEDGRIALSTDGAVRV